MKNKLLALLLCLLFLLSSCTQRSVPARAMPTEISEISEEIQVDLSPFTETSLGQAIVGVVTDVETVVITKADSGEVVYQSADDVLSQGFYDALQMIDEEHDVLDIGSIDYEVKFSTTLGISKQYGLWLKVNQEDPVIVQCNERIWTLTVNESSWIRDRIGGLA